MAGGFLKGTLLGGVVSLGAAGAISVMTPLPPMAPSAPALSAPSAEPPQISDTAPAVGEAPAVSEAAVPAPARETAPQPVQSSPEALAVDPELRADTTTKTQTTPRATPPVVGDAEGLAAPAAVPQTGAVPLTEEDPVFPNPQALAPMLPQEADAVAIDTAPAAPPQPQETPIAEAETAPAAEAQPQEAETAQVPPTEAEPETVAGGASTEDGSADPAADEVTALTPPTVQTDPPETTEAPDLPQTAETTEPDEDSAAVAMLAPSSRPQIGTPATALTDRDTGVIVNRLGNSAAAQDAAEEAVTVIAEDGAATTDDPRPLMRYGQAFANAENKPLMSIVLIDDGTTPTSGAPGIAALRGFPYALSFAVDSSLPDAADRMALYRGAGFEVLAMVDLPQGAQASDVETTLGVTLSQMSEVVGVLEGTTTGLQGAREVSDQVTAILAASGHGLVTQAKGLNTMPKLARKEGVPADPVFRDFDSKDQTAQVIRRFLDQAAFKAGQEGAVIMLGRLRPDTISALLLWGLQDRAGQVALSPISAVLTRADGG